MAFFLPWHLPVAVLDPDFGNLEASRPAIKSAFWDYWETAVFGQILAKSLLEPDFGNLEASRPAIKSAFWDDWETAVFGQILAGSLLDPDFGNLEASRPAIKSAFSDYWGNGRFRPNPGREPFGSQILALRNGLESSKLLESSRKQAFSSEQPS